MEFPLNHFLITEFNFFKKDSAAMTDNNLFGAAIL